MTTVFISPNRLHYRWSGLSDGPVVVLSHSLGASTAMWQRQEASLGKRYRLLLYDHRGHGQSDVPPGPYLIQDFGVDVLRLLDELKLSQVHFCGVSLGGMVGLWLGHNAPDRLSSLVVSNSAAKIEDSSLLRSRISTIENGGLESIAENVLERWFSEPFRDTHPKIIRDARAMLLATAVQGYVATSHAVCDLDLKANLPNIQTPTLVITGNDDRATPPAWGQWIAATIPNAHYVCLQAAHLSNIEAAEAFNDEVLSFLDTKAQLTSR